MLGSEPVDALLAETLGDLHSLDVIPNEIVLNILSFCDLDSILNARYVCVFWNSNETLLLQNYCERNGWTDKPEKKSWLWFAFSNRVIDFVANPEFTGVGKGVKDHRTYEGEWKNGLESGFGTETNHNLKFPDYLRFRGDWVDGKKTGYGSQFWNDGGKYEGEVVDNKFQGQGTFTWSTGEVHVGQFVENLQHGQGHLKWTNGDFYTGNFEQGVFSGEGSLVYTSGTKYVGSFKNGKKEGHGVYSWSTGDLYDGEWFNDLKHGKGSYYWGNKNKVIGEWHEDQRKGGIFYEAVTDREFNYPTLDLDNEIRLESMHSVIVEAMEENKCTYSNTAKKHYFQYLWNVVAEERFAVCFICKKNCVLKNAIKLKESPKKIFGGNFICACGQGLLKSPCASMPHHQQPDK
jgi:hypothetical protein